MKLSHVTACLVTRGDQPGRVREISESLIFGRIVVWDNSHGDDWKCAGRYRAALLAGTPLVYFQDDDVIVPRETQRALFDEWRTADAAIVANYGHGDNPDGYDDLPMVGAGAITWDHEPWRHIWRYAEHYPLDDAFKYEADFVVGALYPSFRHVHLPFEIDLPVAQAPERLCNQPWQRDLKLEITDRARAIRDSAAVLA